MSTAAPVAGFRHTRVYHMAAREMAEHMAAFPWRAPSVLEAAAEQDAIAAGFVTQRVADADQVASIREIVGRMAATGELAREGRKVLMTVSGAAQPKPRNRGIVLALQAIINELGLPAFLHDRVEGDFEDLEGTKYTAYASDLVVVWPN